MVLRQPGVGGRVVVDHVDDTFHVQGVDVVHQMLEVLQGAVFRVDGPVVPDGVGTAQRPLAAFLPDGMDGQEPDDVRAQGFDALQIPAHPLEGAPGGVVADKDGIHDLVPVGFGGVFGHRDTPFQLLEGTRRLVWFVSGDSIAQAG